MGMYFNPGNESFKKALKDKIYVDKTGLLEVLNDIVGAESNCIALSHARRFGKSQAAGMIKAYYSKGCDSRELFSKFEIAGKPSFEEHLNKYNVIHLDMSTITDSFNADVIDEVRRRLIKDFKNDIPEEIDYTQPVESILGDIYRITNARFVIIIDEWDCVVRNYPHEEKLVHKYMQFLHSLFKSEEAKEFLALGYITGILPIKKIHDESALNNFSEYTMLDSDVLTPYFGFTESEVKALCEKYDMDTESVKSWYNGYLINGMHMYNPNSVCEAMRRHRLDSFWKNTSSFGTINNYVTLGFHGLKRDIITILGGGEVKVDVRKFQNDLSIIRSKDDALTALIHLGYLGYHAETRSAYLPNFEVSVAYQCALEESGWPKIAKSISLCEDLLDATIDKDAELVAKIINKAHSAYTSLLKYNDENALACVITMAYFTAPAYYMVKREFPGGTGFADFAFIPRNCNKPAMIIELKWNKSAESAIKQIHDRNYAGELHGYSNEILLVGISYDKESSSKKHTCVIESMEGI